MSPLAIGLILWFAIFIGALLFIRGAGNRPTKFD